MNHFTLAAQESENGLVYMPTIDGRLLCDIVREIELPYAEREGHPSIAGKYVGIPKEMALFPARHFLGYPSSLYCGDVGTLYLMVCDCGEPGCWPFEASLCVSETEISWSNYRQPHRSTWDYSLLPAFRFDPKQYEAALKQ